MPFALLQEVFIQITGIFRTLKGNCQFGKGFPPLALYGKG